MLSFPLRIRPWKPWTVLVVWLPSFWAFPCTETVLNEMRLPCHPELPSPSVRERNQRQLSLVTQVSQLQRSNFRKIKITQFSKPCRSDDGNENLDLPFLCLEVFSSGTVCAHILSWRWSSDTCGAELWLCSAHLGWPCLSRPCCWLPCTQSCYELALMSQPCTCLAAQHSCAFWRRLFLMYFM